MESGLKEEEINIGFYEESVVVLVVMESGLKEFRSGILTNIKVVVVLVVMESGLKDYILIDGYRIPISRSPCCNGEWFKSRLPAT